MEENIGMVRRDQTVLQALREILEAAQALDQIPNPAVQTLSRRIKAAVSTLKE